MKVEFGTRPYIISLSTVMSLILGLTFGSQGAMAKPEAVVPRPTEGAKDSQAGEPTLKLIPKAARDHHFQDSLADCVEPLIPTVVNISIKGSSHNAGIRGMGQRVPFLPMLPFEELQELLEGPKTAVGSGVIYDKNGLILTNYHLIADALPDGEIKVTLSDSTEMPAKIVGYDAKLDIALIRVDSKTPLAFAVLGNSDTARTGDRIITIGNPFGLGGTVTSGIISSTSRDISSRTDSEVGRYIGHFIQTDASINQGSSGGPMFDMQGRVIGINTAIFSPTGANIGLGFAIPINVVKKSIEEIKKFGKVRHGWIGAVIQSVTDEIADSLGLPRKQGALVANLHPEGPALKAGLKTGDVILKFNDVPVKDSRHIPSLIGETPTGKVVPVTIWRDRREQVLKIKVDENDSSEEAALNFGVGINKGSEKLKNVFGMELQSLTRELRERFDIRATAKGVLITEVARNTPAWNKRIRPGDVILSVNQKEVDSPQEVAKLVDEAKQAKRQSVLFLINRGEDRVFIAVPFDEKKMALFDPRT